MNLLQKRVLGIVGSPRRKGNTHLLVSKLLEGARDGGALTSLVFLDRPPILECDGCHSCWKGNLCPKDDRGNELFALIEESDVIVFGTPVYWYGPTALMKALIDRFVFFNCPENRPKIKGKSALLVVPFEEENPATADLLVEFFEKSLGYLEMNLLGKVLAPGVTKRGEIKNRQEVLTLAYELGRRSVGEDQSRRSADRGITWYHDEMLRLKPDIPGAAMWAVSLENTMLSYFELEPGTCFPWHIHESEQITLVLEGILFVDTDTREISVSAGEVVAIPARTPHGIRTGDTKTRAIDAWSPVRNDYLGEDSRR